MTWGEFLTAKFVLWIDTRSSTNNILYGSNKAIEKRVILLPIEKAPKPSGGDLTLHVMCLAMKMQWLT